MASPSLPALAVSLALLAAPAWAAQPARHELSLGATALSYLSYWRSTPGFMVLEVAYHQRLKQEGPWSALRLGGGLRMGMPTPNAHFPMEGFLQAQLATRLGPWEAVVGPELGLSGYAKLNTNGVLPLEELKDLENQRFGPLYVGIGAAPLRFHVGPMLLSALELQLGTSLAAPGSSVRMQLGLVRLGVKL